MADDLSPFEREALVRSLRNIVGQLILDDPRPIGDPFDIAAELEVAETELKEAWADAPAETLQAVARDTRRRPGDPFEREIYAAEAQIYAEVMLARGLSSRPVRRKPAPSFVVRVLAIRVSTASLLRGVPDAQVITASQALYAAYKMIDPNDPNPDRKMSRRVMEHIMEFYSLYLDVSGSTGRYLKDVARSLS